MLRGIIHNGQVVLPEPSDLPEGTEVDVVPVGVAWTADEYPRTEEEIARNLAAMDAVEPFELTDEERKAIAGDRNARREWEKNRFNENAEQLREIWE